MTEPLDMRDTIIPKSDQLNADDLIGGDLTVRIVKVARSNTAEQPIAVSFDGDLNLTAAGADNSVSVQNTLTKASGGNAAATLTATGDVRFENSADLTVSAGALALTLNADSDANAARPGSYGIETCTSARAASASSSAHSAAVRSSNPYANTGRSGRHASRSDPSRSTASAFSPSRSRSPKRANSFA